MASGEKDVLQRQHIVLIHEDAFVAEYLAEVITQSGGVVTRPFAAHVDAALFGGAALVLSDTAPQRDIVLARASELCLPLLIVRSAKQCLTLATTDRVLTVPFAGFQVVEVLCELLQQRTSPSLARLGHVHVATENRIELWGGVECTVNRVGDQYRDQLRLSGHHERVDDLDRFADLGIKALRYPVLWERTAPTGEPDWTWADARLDRLRTLGMRPIVGLVHHGSGPRHTHLLDDEFAPGLGCYAGTVAERFPWIEAWTPVNEPLTTARFAALYGHWYPHAADERSFWLALLNQVDATRAAMTAIRRINPAARLVQTDDLGRTYSTKKLTAQATHDNVRRWASWDLLFGRLDAHHPLFERLDRMGFGDRLRVIADDPCPPDIVGVNHYLTSDRYLDHRVDRYPARLHGGNGIERYADTEALRALPTSPAGLSGALREAWARYRTPIAITEVHNGSTREEQLRWAAQAWDTAHLIQAEGADIVGVTAWSLLGSHGWDTLLRADGSYEAGVFDVSSGMPEETSLACLWRGLPCAALRHPTAHERGWWERPDRLIYAAGPKMEQSDQEALRPLLIYADDEDLSLAVTSACVVRGITHVVLSCASDREEPSDVLP